MQIDIGLTSRGEKVESSALQQCTTSGSRWQRGVSRPLGARSAPSYDALSR